MVPRGVAVAGRIVVDGTEPMRAGTCEDGPSAEAADGPASPERGVSATSSAVTPCWLQKCIASLYDQGIAQRRIEQRELKREVLTTSA